MNKNKIMNKQIDSKEAETKPELYTLLGVVDSEKEQKVLICNNCKDIWIAPKDRCDCGCTTLTKTHQSNYKCAHNYA